jgi:hypothetical protein
MSNAEQPEADKSGELEKPRLDVLGDGIGEVQDPAEPKGKPVVGAHTARAVKPAYPFDEHGRDTREAGC